MFSVWNFGFLLDAIYEIQIYFYGCDYCQVMPDSNLCCFSVSLYSVIAVLDADFHGLPSIQHRQQHGPVCACTC